MMIQKGVGAVSLAMIAALASSGMVQAQNVPSPGDNPQTTQSQGSDMAARVKQALHSEPALNDKHIEVSMDKGKVVMKGFVNSAGDLQKAVRAANKAAGAKNVVNDLKIKTRDETQTNTSGS
jgi:osmotically-inducible protein OsmY